MKATLTNLSPLPREHWAVVTFPSAKSHGHQSHAFLAPGGQIWPAVRGSTKGSKTVFRIRATLGGGESVTGEIVNYAQEPAPFSAHPWVSDNIEDLIPRLYASNKFDQLNEVGNPPIDQFVQPNNGDALEKPSISLVESSPAHQRYLIRQRIRRFGLHLWLWVDMLHDDPVCPIYGKLVFSSRKLPMNNLTFSALALHSGEHLALDFATRHGMQEPFWHDGGWAHLLSDGPVTLRDGSGLPLSGSMLAYTRGKDGMPADPDDLSDPAAKSIRDLRAGLHGDIVGVSHDWDGHWLGNKWVPRLASWLNADRREVLDDDRSSDKDWDDFTDSLTQRAGWFANRPVGLGKDPSQTGGQEDFGATKGTYAVTMHDPRHIHRYRYSVQSELFRGYNHYEEDGTVLRAADHPNWRTWSGLTHWNTSASPDRLGKDVVPFLQPGTGWWGYDDQHRSQNNLAAYLALTDDPCMESMVEHIAETDAAAWRLDFPPGAARAQGRVPGAMAQLMTVVSEPIRTQLLTTADRWISQLGMNTDGKNDWALHAWGPLRVLTFGNPDPRKAVFDDQGNLAPWASMWETGIALVKLYPFIKAMDIGVIASLGFTNLCETIARFGFFKDPESGVWHTVHDLWWQPLGKAPPEPLTAASPHVRSDPGAGSVGQWTFAGVLVAREHLGADHELAPRMNEYIQATTGGEEASSVQSAEWWAAVRDVTFPDEVPEPEPTPGPGMSRGNPNEPADDSDVGEDILKERKADR